MQKQSLLVNNNKYAVFKDSDDFLYPASRIEEYDVVQTSLVSGTLKTIAFDDLTTPIRLEDFFLFSSTAANNKTVNFKLKDITGNILYNTSFASNAQLVSMPKFILLDDYSIELTANTNVEIVRFQFKKVGSLTVQSR
jgi:hypothetical protein